MDVVFSKTPQSTGVVDVFHMLLALVFLSPDTDKKLRFETVFRLFDTDDDGCLTHDQILKMYATIRMITPILIGKGRRGLFSSRGRGHRENFVRVRCLLEDGKPILLRNYSEEITFRTRSSSRGIRNYMTDSP